MSFQAQVNIFTALGIVGNQADDSPVRAQTWNLYSNGQAQSIGYAFTKSSGGNPAPIYPSASSMLAGTAQVGGAAPAEFAGILVNPLEQTLWGTSGVGTALSPSLILPDYSIGALATFGQFFVSLASTALVGNLVFYDNTTGALDSVFPTSTFTGVVSTNTLTVSAFVAGGAPIRVGTAISGTGVDVGTVVTALGSGAGGNGTYTVNGEATVSSTTMTGNAVAASGKTFVPKCIVTRYDVAAASSIAAIQLSN
jgi:hypothetical protein